MLIGSFALFPNKARSLKQPLTLSISSPDFYTLSVRYFSSVYIWNSVKHYFFLFYTANIHLDLFTYLSFLFFPLCLQFSVIIFLMSLEQPDHLLQNRSACSEFSQILSKNVFISLSFLRDISLHREI